MRFCSKCKQSKPESEFNRRTRGGFQSHCRGCQNAYFKAHYLANKDSYRAKSVKKREAAKQFLRAAKEAPCTDCGIQYPYYVMQFDHLDADTKTENVATLINYSINRLKQEISKCELVCANCHAERTHARRNNVL